MQRQVLPMHVCSVAFVYVTTRYTTQHGGHDTSDAKLFPHLPRPNLRRVQRLHEEVFNIAVIH